MTSPPLRTRPGLGARYWRLFAASTVSNLGDGVFAVALPLITVGLTRDPTTVAGVAAAQRLPWLLFALPAGALVDRGDRRRIMVAADMARGAIVAALAGAVAADVHTVAWLYVTGFVLGMAETLFDNASQTILPRLVDPDQLPRANGNLFATETITNSFVGPPLGGFLVAAAASLPLWLDGGSYLVAAALVASLPGRYGVHSGAAARPGRGDPRPHLGREIAEGVRWLWGHRLLRSLALLLGLMNLWLTAGFAVLVLFATERLGLDEVGFGLLLTATAVGSVVGGLVAGRLA
ncbi:MAG: MFS transporter, partial [Actinomyces sp.]